MSTDYFQGNIAWYTGINPWDTGWLFKIVYKTFRLFIVRGTAGELQIIATSAPNIPFSLWGVDESNLPRMVVVPATVAERSDSWTVFTRSNTGVVGSNPTWGMDVCVWVYSVFVLSCV
jgi:hypothetical protein